MEGSLPILYKSLEISATNKKKDTYLKPVTTSPLPLLGLGVGDASTRKETCSCDCDCDSDIDYCECPHYGRKMQKVSSEWSGLVKGVVTYMVMDDLEIKPMSTISSITLLNDFNIKNVILRALKLVYLTMKEVLSFHNSLTLHYYILFGLLIYLLEFVQAIKLLKISLQSNNVLTQLFCYLTKCRSWIFVFI